MNLEEIGSVLRWHEANGTYPKRTIKVRCTTTQSYKASSAPGSTRRPARRCDVVAPTASVTRTSRSRQSRTWRRHHYRARRGRHREPDSRVGGNGRDEHDPVGPAAAGDTKINVASVNGFAVGHNVSVDRRRRHGTSRGRHRPATATTLAAAAAGDTNIKVARVTNMVAGEQIRSTPASRTPEYRHDHRRRHRRRGRHGRHADAGAHGRPREWRRGAGPRQRHHADLALTHAHRATARVVDTAARAPASR